MASMGRALADPREQTKPLQPLENKPALHRNQRRVVLSQCGVTDHESTDLAADDYPSMRTVLGEKTQNVNTSRE